MYSTWKSEFYTHERSNIDSGNYSQTSKWSKISIISILNYKIRQNIVKIKHLLKIDNLVYIYIYSKSLYAILQNSSKHNNPIKMSVFNTNIGH